MRAMVLMFTCLLCLSRAAAFTLNSDDPNLKGWRTNRLSVNVAVDACQPGVDYLGVIHDAMQVWNGVPGADIALSIGRSDSTTTAAVARSGNAPDSPLITCDPAFQTDTGMNPNFVPGVGGVSVNTETHRIVYGYVILNSQDDVYASAAGLDRNRLTIVVAHELGHLLGLGHSSDSNALMYPNITNLQRAALADDDIAGLRHLYPPGGLSDDDQSSGCGRTARFENGRPLGSLHAFFSFSGMLLACMAGLAVLKRWHRPCSNQDHDFPRQR